MFQQARKVLGATAALAALALGASAIAGAASSGTTGATGSSSSARPAFNGPAHGTSAHENAERAVTGAAAVKAQTAAEKAVGSGTAGAVTSDYTGAGYETTVTKSDGSKVEVHLDSSFSAMQRPGGPGGPPGGPDGPGA